MRYGNSNVLRNEDKNLTAKKKNKSKICSSSNLNIDVSNVVMKKIKKKKEETENTV